MFINLINLFWNENMNLTFQDDKKLIRPISLEKHSLAF